MEQLIIFLVLITIGYISGKTVESRHFRSIEAREREYLQLPAVTLRDTGDDREISDIRLVAGNVVISVDFFKRFLAQLRNIFGGQISSYETLVDRARREAILRMKDESKDADIILNLRIETSSISKGKKNTIGSIEVLAYGTAVTYVPGSVRKPLPPPEPAATIKKTGAVKPVPKTDRPMVGQPVKKPLPKKPVPKSATPATGTPVKPPSPKNVAPNAVYRIVFSGQIADGQTLGAVKKRMAELYKMPPAKCDKMFAGTAVTVKDNVDAQTAKQYKQAFERTGAICRIERVGKKPGGKT